MVLLVAGLIKPVWFNRVFKNNATRKKIGLTFGLALVVVVIISAIVSPTANSGQNNNKSQLQTAPAKQAAASPTPTPPTQQAAAQPTPTAPQTDQQKLDAAVKSQLQQASLPVSYNNTTIESDDSNKPKGSQYVTVDLNTGEFLDGNAFVTGTGKLTSDIMQQVFPINPNFYDVLLRYNGQTTDQYGNATTTMIMSYEMDRPLYSKINWSNFSNTLNDVHLCAFIREQFNTMSQSDKFNSYIGCAVLASDITGAENSIETGNPQFKDIPQYGN